MPDTHRLVKTIRDEYYAAWRAEREPLEETWNLAYDAFRGKYSSSNLARWRRLEGTEWRSKVFVRLTRLKVLAAVAQIEDVLFQGGALPYRIAPTPQPEWAPGLAIPREEAEERCRRMHRALDDVLAEAHFRKKLMGAILEMAVYGMACLKCPVIRPLSECRYVPQVPGNLRAKDTRAVPGSGSPSDPGGPALHWNPSLLRRYGRLIRTETTRMAPGVDHPNLWDLFWDMEAGDFQSGQGIIHRLKMSPGMLAGLVDRPGFLPDAVRRAVASQADRSGGGTETSEGPGRAQLKKRARTIEVLEFWGRVPVEDLAGTKLDGAVSDSREAEIMCVIAGDEIIRPPVLNPYPDGRRPFRFGVWEEVPHEAVGVGIPENMKDSQMMVNSAVRCFIDNKALSGNVLMAGNPRNLAAGQNRSVYPGKFFELAEHVTDVRQALQFFSPPDVGSGLLDLVGLFERFADEESGVPKLLEGQSSQYDPRTAFAFSRLLENANRQLGKVVRNIDEGLIVPSVEGIYHWLMAVDPRESIKGDYRVNATGSDSYRDRITRGENLQNFLMFALSSPVLAPLVKPRPLLAEVARTRGLDADAFLRTEEEAAEVMEEIAKALAEESKK
jgi:hypothetical protein